MKTCKSFTLLIFVYFVQLFTAQAQIPNEPNDVTPLHIGELIPNSELINAVGEFATISNILKKQPTVLVFYRGSWCPYCNMQLSVLAEKEEEILKLGYQIVAVSPDDYKNLAPTITQNEIKYNVFSDPKGALIQKMGIAFSATPNTINYISKKTIGEITEVLPVPSVFIVNTNGKILFEHLSSNYKKRLSPKLLMSALKKL